MRRLASYARLGGQEYILEVLVDDAGDFVSYTGLTPTEADRWRDIVAAGHVNQDRGEDVLWVVEDAPCPHERLRWRKCADCGMAVAA